MVSHFFYMHLRYLTQIRPKSICNILNTMKPLPGRDELHLLSTLRYSLAIQKDQPNKPHPELPDLKPKKDN